MSALLIARGSETDASHGALVHVVGVLFVRLYISAKLDYSVFRCDKLASGHHIPGRIFARDAIRTWERIQPEDHILD